MRFAVLLVFCFVVTPAEAQREPTFLEVTYLQKINTHAGEPDAAAYATDHMATLLADASRSTYRYGQGGTGKAVEQRGELNFHISYDDERGSVFHTDRQREVIISREMVRDQPFIITEDIPELDWDITTETKDIGGYPCTKATAHFRGRTYEAWFTPQIPLSAGPWKLGGLPGLILEARDLTGVISFTFAGLRKATSTENNTPPKAGKPVDFATFFKLRRQKTEEYLAKIAAVPGVTVKLTGRQGQFELDQNP